MWQRAECMKAIISFNAVELGGGIGTFPARVDTASADKHGQTKAVFRFQSAMRRQGRSEFANASRTGKTGKKAIPKTHRGPRGRLAAVVYANALQTLERELDSLSPEPELEASMTDTPDSSAVPDVGADMHDDGGDDWIDTDNASVSTEDNPPPPAAFSQRVTKSYDDWRHAVPAILHAYKSLLRSGNNREALHAHCGSQPCQSERYSTVTLVHIECSCR